MLAIPITFECEGKTYTGELSQVMGGGSTSTFHLMINKYYCGRLRYGPDGWVFDGTPKTMEFETLAGYFGNYIISWVDSDPEQTNNFT